MGGPCHCSFNLLIYRDDLLKPSGEVKSSTVIINEGSEIDSSPIYKTDKTPKLVKVSELIDILQASADEISLNESQREAVCRALSQSLSIIQVYYKVMLL